MKGLLITIAAVVLVGCGPSVDIFEAAWSGDIEAVKQHLAAGTDVNAKSEYGKTALHFGALENKKDIVELLIANGADVNARDNKGRTPLDWVALRGWWNQDKMAALLRKHGGKTGAELKAEGKK